ncbi:MULTISPECIES: 5-(carboxyamino)imidazole ribonucleotide synthase [Chryseobacterium]|uniref:N5-carboxyaminoimidazole ribonucleotide synthase n=1 Tax=Chryseobacterium cucumeris TaxID=1813611 RepID=A0ABX9X456_9FLAO|nr:MULTISPECIES: 5-(carboxyamino)imidazole ribonucleotide synthase [Chryseobacterium]MDH5032318.1 5-(carboxyamino)imidazole ribonucleotide synthase [Chryseobacterium cucumeris]QRA41762.1 5-(carboxyamino)imidazole ribonucleotide synthase [Chryseobacterium cucumeris]QWT85970.1 5-(carboxyamino)imidazole ribonucleotide synthase [Chryseobacterium sp. PCH239]ROH90577.1 5-(carboxyamino)imidazole ribonucleotide synthase [Chryseobacterium cucumeris]WFB69458.1 5-(carboxyamino)imidazole ribonucleotide sy
MKIGILGGGQLGRMLIQSALKYDDEFYTLDPASDAPCHNISYFTQGNFNDYETVLNFGKDKDVVTIEIEHVNADALAELEKQGIKVVPNANIIKTIQQKILQKEFYKAHDIPSPEFQVVWNSDEKIIMPLPFVQKMNTGGYDGKGVQVIKTEEDYQQLWTEPSVIESLVDIEKELSVIVARNEKGETNIFPVTEMVADPKLNLLDFNVCPVLLTEDVQNQIDSITEKFLAAVNSPGLFAIELFLDKEGKVWVNETAPRLHNSGHQSQEGNTNSQFEQMYRVVKNLPLADTDAITYSGMLNLVGAEGYSGKVVYEGMEDVLKLPETYIHLYGKTETKPGRKMGHINVLADSREELMEKLVQVKGMVRVIAE